MKQICLLLLLLVVVGLSQAVQYRRIVSYEGELVARWYEKKKMDYESDNVHEFFLP